MSKRPARRATKRSAGMMWISLAWVRKEVLASRVRRFPGSFSTKTTGSAPREAASTPTTPEPENRSRNEVPVRSPRMAKRLSRIRSMAGRITPGGQRIVRPL